MNARRRSELGFPRTGVARPARGVLATFFVVLLVACDGGSSTGGGTQNSPFVGTYNGATNVTVASNAGTETASESITIVVNRDGIVQVGDAHSTIYASGPLSGDRLRIDGDAAALVDPECSGTIILAGTFEAGSGDEVRFRGSWSSDSTSCFGISGTVTGPIEAARVDADTRASRVLETSSPTLRQVFRDIAG